MGSDSREQKWWVRWIIVGDDPRPVKVPQATINVPYDPRTVKAPAFVEWWNSGDSMNFAIVYAVDEVGCRQFLNGNGWPECERLDLCQLVESDWRPHPNGFPDRRIEGEFTLREMNERRIQVLVSAHEALNSAGILLDEPHSSRVYQCLGSVSDTIKSIREESAAEEFRLSARGTKA